MKTIHSFILLVIIMTTIIAQPVLSNNTRQENHNMGQDRHSKDFRPATNPYKTDSQGTILIHLRRGETLQQAGRFTEAMIDFKTALEVASGLKPNKLDKNEMEILALQSLGYLYHLKQKDTLAQTYLTKAFIAAVKLKEPLLIAMCANRLGIVHYSMGNIQKAYEYLNQAMTMVNKTNDNGLKSAVYRNLARLTTDKKTAFSYLSDAFTKALAVDDPGEKCRLLLGISSEINTEKFGSTQIEFRYQVLEKALTIAGNKNDPRLISRAVGKKGRLYEEQNRYIDALFLTEQAVEAAQEIGARDLLLEWEWQRSRILRKQGQLKKAISSLRRATHHIESIRQDIPEGAGVDCAPVNEMISPIYMDLAEILLEESREKKPESARQIQLREAQKAVESIKQSQLRDYFNDPCIDALSQPIQSLAPGTAVIYPIIFPDRIEILADIGGKLFHQTQPVQKKRLEKTIQVLAYNLRNGSFYKKLSQTVYTWLIEPLEFLFEQQGVDTLVFVPDGVFRILPIAGLYDGRRFLIEKYAVVTEPGLTLLDPNELPRGEMKTLLAGVSVPGPVVMDLPVNLLETLSKTDLNKKKLGVRGLSVKTEQLKNSEKSTKNLMTQIEIAEHIKKVLALPGVEREIEILSDNLPGQTILNHDFILDGFAEKINEQDFRIIHIASHGFFGGTEEQNFIMTYDKKMSMKHLEDFIKPKQLAKKPIELITLSACQTAEGDDKSPMGLSGVALKSGARSVIGSLWPVSDMATQMLLSRFYINLKNEKMTKARALQKAQQDLIRKKEFQHPFYWSAFILVGNWL